MPKSVLGTDGRVKIAPDIDPNPLHFVGVRVTTPFSFFGVFLYLRVAKAK